MIKIDAEGYDLEVIKGAESVIHSCDVVLIEAAIMCKSLKNDLRTVINEMAALGFRPFDITDLNRPLTNGSLWLVEIAFIRIGGHFDQLFDRFGQTRGARRERPDSNGDEISKVRRLLARSVVRNPQSTKFRAFH